MATIIQVPRVRLITDETGQQDVYPGLLVDGDPVEPLLAYFREHCDKSADWQKRRRDALATFMRYVNANEVADAPLHEIFKNFAHILLKGSVDKNGRDPSGLYWMPVTPKRARDVTTSLTEFFDWLHREYGTPEANPKRPPTAWESRLQEAARYRAKEDDFLGHLSEKNESTSDPVANFRIRGEVQPQNAGEQGAAFPEHKFAEFFQTGLSEGRDVAHIFRDRLIVLLLHYGGLRLSEALQLWIDDVVPHPRDPAWPIVQIAHPEQAPAPDPPGRQPKQPPTRAQYLQAEYGRPPRTLETLHRRAGFKGQVVDNMASKSLYVWWFPQAAGYAFMRLWREYLRCRAQVDTNHEYAFINFRQNAEPLAPDTFRSCHSRAVQRIGLRPGARWGLSPKGHRHAYKARLESAGVPPGVIKRGMHHGTLQSQDAYGGYTEAESQKMFEQAEARLEAINHQLLNK